MKGETVLGEKCHGNVFKANENGLYRNLPASEVSIVKDIDCKKDSGVVPIVKQFKGPPDLVRLYGSDGDSYNDESTPTTENSCLGRDLVVSVKPTVEIPTSGDDTRYEFVCLDCTLDPGGSPSCETPRYDKDTPCGCGSNEEVCICQSRRGLE